MYEIMQEVWNLKRKMEEQLEDLNTIFYLLQEKYFRENGYYWKEP